MEKIDVPKIFGENVFNETIMQQQLPQEIYQSMKNAIDNGLPLEPEVAEVVAYAMKEWAIEKGATHYTHWFQPMTGITAEKHDAFITPSLNGKVLMEFSGKELIKGEPDASSFPSGGLRNTFEARGYTAWDPTSYAFIKDAALYIPTAFCSYSGEVLDKKTPLLRSMQVISREALRITKLFGNQATHIITTVGAEQEYFLVDRELFKQRKDLLITGRTLFGAKPPKGQEMDDHYFRNLTERVSAFMHELDKELWKMGILAKTKHSEAAPAQFELAPIFTTTNISTDHNQLTMELMKKIAKHHGLICLLHEKPFEGVNGSGKHNNWSLSTNLGENLLKPGKDPANKPQFLLFFTAVIEAVSRYGDMLRASTAMASNDHRLGASEAPPAIVSMFIGNDLLGILESIERGEKGLKTERQELYIGVATIPALHKDSTDRNRTSPMAFTGNKFEFRMLGSSASIADTNIVINTAVASVLKKYADRLEKAENFDAEVMSIIAETIAAHKHIIFNGNNYTKEWLAEAEKRGLPNLKSSVDAIPAYIDPKNLELFSSQGIFTNAELHSRYEIMLETYTKTIHIEAQTMINMVNRQILPAVIDYSKNLFEALYAKKVSELSLDLSREEARAAHLNELTETLITLLEALANTLTKAKAITEPLALARFYHDTVLNAMNSLRKTADELETLVADSYWPFPTYLELLFNI
ncbi:MAG: glutamine synthetase III [Clostridia bacterium]|nr:glutamine synthetase III [Clostridia bacterium]